jgi:hypothetical protein
MENITYIGGNRRKKVGYLGVKINAAGVV